MSAAASRSPAASQRPLARVRAALPSGLLRAWRRGLLRVWRTGLAAALLVLLLGLAPAAALASLLHLEGAPPPDLGLHDGNLSACASPAHCACDDWTVADPGAALQRLRQRLEAMPGAVLRQSSDTYLYATVSSRLFGFVDDLELYADSAAGRIQAISRSRLGDSDLGVNARRLEALRQALSDAA